MRPARTAHASSGLRAAATRRINRQNAAVAETVRAWKVLREAEEAKGDTQAAILALRVALENLDREMEN